MIRFFLFCFVFFTGFSSYGQAGLAATPVKFYYTIGPGGNETQTVTISNPTNIAIEVGVSFGDWRYTNMGSNETMPAGTLKTSMADWIQVLPSSYFVLQPRERKQLELVVSVPPDANREVPVHTALVYFSQLNPGGGGIDENGAAIKVTVKMAVKVYHRFHEIPSSAIEITNFNTFKMEQGKTALFLQLENQGNSWTKGEIAWELFNKSTGKKIELDQNDFYTLPGDKRRIEKTLPEDLSTGEYTMTVVVRYDHSDKIKVGELSFSLK